MEEKAKLLCTKFFYWWFNQPGNNTEQGFDEWAKTEEGKDLILQSFREVAEKAFEAGENYNNDCRCGICDYCMETKDKGEPCFTEYWNSLLTDKPESKL